MWYDVSIDHLLNSQKLAFIEIKEGRSFDISAAKAYDFVPLNIHQVFILKDRSYK